MIFKIIVSTYCITGLIINLLILPKRNKEVSEQNKVIIKRYERLDLLMDKIEDLINITNINNEKEN